jgi:type II secretory ATPase GspE/PulE/Tfp pilus assembly ATPase PilB-like protein
MINPTQDKQREQNELAAKNFAAQIGFEYFDTQPKLDITNLSDIVTLEGMRAYNVVPLVVKDKHLTFGVSEDTKRDTLPALSKRLSESGYDSKFVFISKDGWTQLFNRYSIAESSDLLEKGDFSAISRKLDNIEPKFMLEPLAQLAYQLDSSDIHIEPGEDTARVRFRIDGTLHPIIELTKERYELLTSDLQIRANVKWGADIPQGGRVSVKAINPDGEQINLNMRLETVPSLHGQDVVIRIFNMSAKYLSFDNMQLYKEQQQTIIKAISHPQGLVLTVGPTGSGKTSTLYAIMNYLNNDEIKIVTLEDPVEYELEGISQVPVRSDQQQLFMDELRAVMREDPNVVMIGEIRDTDTAKTALQASLTGHLVLSTFHASSSAAAVTRLVDMIGQNPLLASSTRLIIAQRLVRLLCNVCKKPYEPSREELLAIKAAFHDMAEADRPKTEGVKLYKAVGCEACHHFGYDGRIAIIELMEMSVKLQALIGQATAATTTQAIQQAAVSEGMATLLQDGLRKVLEGKVTFEEVNTQVGG